jgi:hypothetical protein
LKLRINRCSSFTTSAKSLGAPFLAKGFKIGWAKVSYARNSGSPDIFVEGDRAGVMRVADGDIGGIGFG